MASQSIKHNTGRDLEQIATQNKGPKLWTTVFAACVILTAGDYLAFQAEEKIKELNKPVIKQTEEPQLLGQSTTYKKMSTNYFQNI